VNPPNYVAAFSICIAPRPSATVLRTVPGQLSVNDETYSGIGELLYSYIAIAKYSDIGTSPYIS